MREAIETLDVVVFVPIEARDRVAFSPADAEGSTRAAVDEKLREILIDDAWQLALEVVEVTGDPETRASSALRRLDSSGR